MNKSFYVSSTNGNDRSSGTDQNTPFASLQKAADVAEVGDTVYVMPGNYSNSDPNQNVVTINKSGTAGAPITFKAFDPNNKPVIKVRNYVGIEVAGSYINLDGLIVEGNAKEFSNMTVEQVDALQKSQGRFTSPITSGTGIAIGGFYRNASPHHVSVTNSIVKDNPGGGISTIRADYITIENNEVAGNSFYSTFNTSGISLYQNNNSDGSNGLKNIIRGNVVHSNKNLIKDFNHFREEDLNNPDPALRPKITDGNGIIIDDATRTQVIQSVDGGQSPQNLPAYQGKTLIENNKVYDNGARGIQTFNSSNVEIKNNTLANNLLTPGIWGENVTVNSTAAAKAKGADQGVTLSNNNIVSRSAILDLVNAAPVAKSVIPTPVAPLATAITVPTQIVPAVANSASPPLAATPAPSPVPVITPSYTKVGENGSDTLTGSNFTGFNDLFGLGGDDTLNSGNASKYNYLVGGVGNDQINLSSTGAVMDIIGYESGAGKDTVAGFVRGRDEMNDQVHFKGIQNVDVVSKNGNTELHVGDGITGNAGFGTGELLIEIQGTTGFKASDIGISLFGSNFAF
jgi:parallel beta-helix repeat protein